MLDAGRSEAVDAEIAVYNIPYNRQILGELLEQGQVFRNFIIGRLEARGLPCELFFVPLIESEYEPRATSSAGAVGLWQLIEETARTTGLAIDEWHDERRDFWKATESALDILESNYKYYGDWLLALAAYNAGRGAIDAAVAKARTKDFYKIASLGLLPDETARYVPKILAAGRLGSYPGRNGLPYSWEKGYAWTRVRLTQPVDLKTLAAKTSVPYEVLQEANTELNFRVTPPSGVEYFVKIPGQDRPAVEKTLRLPAEELVDSSLHTVRSGDTYYSLARYYRIPLHVLLAYNIRFTSRKLPIGARIVIPQAKDNIPPPPRAVLFTGKQFTSVYLVKAHDTYFSIARAFQVPVEELVANNARTLETVIRTGDALKVPVRMAEK
jgi:membrane-bound lytic murein transglycosylase D